MAQLVTKRERYQAGSISVQETAEGQCWYIRFRQAALDGTLSRPWVRIGLVRDIPTKAKAHKLAEPIRRSFNDKRHVLNTPKTISDVIHRYMAEEMPARYSTAKAYRNLLLNHIGPNWGTRNVGQISAQEIRNWLRLLPLSPKTRGHVRDMMRTLFRFAMLWEWIPLTDNPMSLFRLERATQRSREPRVLTPGEFSKLLSHPKLTEEPYRTMLMIAACLGLRSSEIFGLQWADVLWDEGILRVQRSVVEGRMGDVKTKYSAKPLPLHVDVIALLRAQFKRTDFQLATDWVFASPFLAGEKTYHAQGIQQHRISLAARETGLGAGIGWHTIRHSYRAWLGSTKVDVGVQRELMRHANIATTMNVYGAAFVEDLRKANEGVVRMVIQ